MLVNPRLQGVKSGDKLSTNFLQLPAELKQYSDDTTTKMRRRAWKRIRCDAFEYFYFNLNGIVIKFQLMDR
jgi:hypothetical protein